MTKNFDRANMGVLATVAEYGVSSKTARGVVADPGPLPRCLEAAQATLLRFAARHRLTLAGRSSTEISHAIVAVLTPGVVPARDDELPRYDH